MRRIVRHAKYRAKRSELAKKYPEFLDYLDRLEQLIAENPGWPVSVYAPAYDCWWSHFLVEDESIPHMRVYHVSDDEEVRMLAIVPAEPSDD